MEQKEPPKSPKEDFSPATKAAIDRIMEILKAPSQSAPVRKVTDHYWVIGR